MQLSLQKHYIQFTLKYVLLKYVISVIGTFLKVSDLLHTGT